ncbi:MAG TPA: hypothetical protein VFO86_01055 [Terriglobia bacterium]|nr:hypothetical protein [Terriglobia bacterium]
MGGRIVDLASGTNKDIPLTTIFANFSPSVLGSQPEEDFGVQTLVSGLNIDYSANRCALLFSVSLIVKLLNTQA